LATTAVTPRSALLALWVLTSINLLNYVDRYIVSPLVPDLERSLHITDAQISWLVPSFMLVYMLTAPLFGAWGDRGSRTRPIALGVFIWSLATMLSGLAQNYPQLLAARALVGIGEAAYVAISPALLADLFDEDRRGRIYAVLNMAIPIGAALGYILGGWIGHHFGWRPAFFVGGAPGMLVALAVLWLPDPPRGARDKGGPTGPKPGAGIRGALRVYLNLAARMPYLLAVLGYAAYTFALGGLAFWMPTFLERVRGIPMLKASTTFGAIVVVTGFLGTLAGGWLGDYCLKRSRQGYLWFCGVSTLLAVPFALLALTAAAPTTYYPAIVVAELLLFMSTGPVNAAIANMVSPLERASAIALSMFAIHLFGDVPSPVIIGHISNAESLARAVLIVPLAIAVGGLIWLVSAHVAARSAAARTA
jgi:MFS transporter, Spinster family, sphingosine-1-phosphate transporter